MSHIAAEYLDWRLRRIVVRVHGKHAYALALLNTPLRVIIHITQCPDTGVILFRTLEVVFLYRKFSYMFPRTIRYKSADESEIRVLYDCYKRAMEGKREESSGDSVDFATFVPDTFDGMFGDGDS